MDEPDYAHQAAEEEVKPEPVAEKVRVEGDEEEEAEAPAEEVAEEEEEELDEDGNPIPKKVEVVVVKKDFSKRISSERDQMIEIKWSETII